MKLNYTVLIAFLAVTPIISAQAVTANQEWFSKPIYNDFGEVKGRTYYYEAADHQKNEVVLITLDGISMKILRFDSQNQPYNMSNKEYFMKVKDSAGNIKEYTMKATNHGFISLYIEHPLAKQLMIENGRPVRIALYDGNQQLLNSIQVTTVSPDFKSRI